MVRHHLWFIILFFINSNALAQAYCVHKSVSDLHREASLKSPITWRVGKYMPLQGTGKRENNWIQVTDLEGEAHWVLRKDITTKIKCLVIATKFSRVRKGPGKNFEPIFIPSYDRYTPFKDMGGEDGWTRVVNGEGTQGWVNLDHVWKPMGQKLRVSFSPD